ncbi:MAG: methyltransferase domain-containing protein [Gemmatimonadota bacterium]|nr:methyltransferase domain-containing protein [Gemmatimonadota bacterium]
MTKATPESVSNMDDRIDRERQFHNREYQDQSRSKVWSYYAVARRCYDDYHALLTRHCRDRRVLEYGCGSGSAAPLLARSGGKVTGIDLSEVAIDQARDAARAQGLDIEYRVMNAEAMTFDDRSFDLICGSGILHHLDLESAYRELARTLRPGGIAVFAEPLGHNPAINAYRRLTPGLRTPDEHPLVLRDFALARRYFRGVEVQHYTLFPLALIPMRRAKLLRRLLPLFEALDDAAFSAIPFVRRFAWCSIITLSDPHAHEPSPPSGVSPAA